MRTSMGRQAADEARTLEEWTFGSDANRRGARLCPRRPPPWWVAAFFALLVGCAADDPLAGTWVQPEATTLLPGGEVLGVDATLTLDPDLDPDAATPNFTLALALSFEALEDTLELHGTYEDEGDLLTLRVEDISSPPESGNATRVDDDGTRCITLMGFGGAEVCFPSPQANDFSLRDDTLTVVIDQAILGAPVSQTTLALRREP